MESKLLFNSEQERQCYLEIIKYIPEKDVIVNDFYPLCDNPFPVRFQIDFETPNYFIEYKGRVAQHGIWSTYRTKLAWFLSLYGHKKPYLLVFSNSAKTIPNLKGITTIRLRQLQHYLTNQI